MAREAASSAAAPSLRAARRDTSPSPSAAPPSSSSSSSLFESSFSGGPGSAEAGAEASAAFPFPSAPAARASASRRFRASSFHPGWCARLCAQSELAEPYDRSHPPMPHANVFCSSESQRRALRFFGEGANEAYKNDAGGGEKEIAGATKPGIVAAGASAVRGTKHSAAAYTVAGARAPRAASA